MKQRENIEMCSWCKDKGWWENEFLDQLYCEKCPLGEERKCREAVEGRLSDGKLEKNSP